MQQQEINRQERKQGRVYGYYKQLGFPVPSPSIRNTQHPDFQLGVVEGERNAIEMLSNSFVVYS